MFTPTRKQVVHRRPNTKGINLCSRSNVLTAMLSFTYALFIVYGIFFKVGADWTIPFWLIIFLIFLITLPFFFGINKLWELLDSHSNFKTIERNQTKFLIASCAFILICWIVVWLASWPGYYCYDTIHFNMYLQNGTLSTQQSVFHTFVVGNVLRVSLAIFGGFNRAVAFYIFLQMLVCFLLIIWMLRIMIKKEAPRFVVIVSVAFFALCPSISLFVICTTKDVMFSIFLVAFSVNVYLIFNEENSKKLTRKIFFLVILTFLVIIERNNGIYGIIPSSIIFFILLKKRCLRKVTLVTLALVGGVFLDLFGMVQYLRGFCMLRHQIHLRK